MRRFLIEDIGEIACAMYDTIVDDGLSDVTFVGYCDDVIAIVKELLMFDEILPYDMEIEPEEIGGYDKEYYVTLDNDLNIWCCKAYDVEHNRYLYDESRRVFIADDCSSAILKEIGCDDDNMYEVSYDTFGDDECDGNCACCQCGEKDTSDDNHEVITRVAVDENGKLRGFEKFWNTEEDGLHYHSTYSFFSNNEDMLKNMLDNFNIKY
jgi:hypothetical protein